MIAVLGWDMERGVATIELHAEGDDESCNEGYRLVQTAMRERPWRKMPDHNPADPDSPDEVLSFLGRAFAMIGYEVKLHGDIVDANARLS